MGITPKFVGITLGFCLVLASFLFFGRQQNTYNWLLFSGLIISLVSFVVILLEKHPFKSKIYTIVFVIVFIVVEQFLEPKLIETSFKTFINQHIEELNVINSILANKSNDIFILNEDVKDDSQILTDLEKKELISVKQKTGAYMISKTNDKIYYGLWGLLDVRIGIVYWIGKFEPTNNYKHLKGAWYN
jgi:hypothetical protein